jgi:3-deoxy-manno-octulosonate cytidylyltransferase (CMP-KDO synthetase)
VIATDSEEVAAAASSAGAECVLTSPQHRSGTDRVAEVAAHPEYADYRVIVNVQGDEPFISEAIVSGATNIVASGRAALGTAATGAPSDAADDPDVVKVVCADDGRAMYFSRSGIPFVRDNADEALRTRTLLQHIGVYAYTREALAAWVALPEHPLERIERLEQLRPLAAGIPMGVAIVDEPAPIGIDTEADLAHANERWSQLNAGR